MNRIPAKSRWLAAALLLAGAAPAATAADAAAAIAATPAGVIAQTPTQAQSVVPLVDARTAQLQSIARQIWAFAEVGFKETKSTALLQEQLKKAGFKVDAGVAGMPTAFVASAGSGGPVIAILAEFDALPGLAQKAVPHLDPISGQLAGHGCGHNLFAAGSVTAAIAIKEWLQKNGVQGTVRLYGSPAEEGGFGKVYMVRDGLFKDVDVTLTWHPGDRNSATPSRSLAMIAGKFRFEGVAAHAAAAPERGRSALDAVEIMDVATNFLREHVPQGTRIQYVITKGGGQPNIVPAEAENFYYVRNHDVGVLKDVWQRVINAAQGAALATGTKVSVDLISGTYDTLPNVTLNSIVHRNLAHVGGFTYTPADQSFAAAILKTYPERKISVSDPSAIEPMGPETLGYASSDVGDVSWVTPTASLSTATFVRGTSAHSWQAAATAGTDIGEKGALVAARTLALTAAELFLEPGEIAAAKAEFAKRRGPDFKYHALLGDRAPALDYTDH